MVIKRNVDGRELEFELTPAEMKDTFYEQRHKWDIDNVLNLSEYLYESDNDILCDLADKMRNDSYFINAVAFRYRDLCDDYPDGEQEMECFIAACSYISGINENELWGY